MKRFLIFIVLVLPIVALLYFGLTRDPQQLPSALIGKPAPDFSLTDIEGKTVALSSLQGNAVVLNFWSTWCNTCLAEHRIMQEAQKIAEKSGITILSVLYEDTPENAKQFVSRYGKGAPILLDPNLKAAIDYGVAGVPETFFIDRRGLVRYKKVGILTPDILWKEMERIAYE